MAINKLTIKVVVEDTAPKRPLLGEHGLSLWIEADEHRILFDSGFSGVPLMRNLMAMELQPTKLDAFVLSHPHDDHSGGMRAILQHINNIPVYCVSHTFEAFVPDAKAVSLSLNKIHYVKNNIEIFPGIFIAAEKDSINTPIPTKEINLVIPVENKGLVIVAGCSHHGLVDMINSAKALFNNELPVYAVIGGLHLKGTPPAQIKEIVKFLKDCDLKILAPNHCTGYNAIKLLRDTFPEATAFLKNSDSGTFHTGMSLEIK